jgi:hypothetical protein
MKGLIHILGSQKATRQLSLCVSLFVAASVLGSCGTETGNPVIKRPTTPRTVAQDTVESDLLELSESISEQGSNDVAFNFAAEKNSANVPAEVAECSSSGTAATTMVEKTRENKKEFSKRGRSVLVSQYRKITTEWLSPNGGLSCVGKNLKKNLRSLKGASETRKGSVNRTITRTFNSAAVAESEYSSARFASEGVWKTNFAEVSLLNDSLLVTKTNEWSLKKSSFQTTSQGETIAESSSETAAGAPIKVVTARSRDTGAITSRTIESGTITTTRPDGTKIEVSFEAVVFTTTDSCYPTNGKMRGLVTPAPSSGQSPESFEIDFTQLDFELPSIQFGDGQKVPLSGACVE